MMSETNYKASPIDGLVMRDLERKDSLQQFVVIFLGCL